MESPIVFYYYFDVSDSDAFCSELERRFRESGHNRPIEFHSWNCYNDAPPEGGDIYCYDGLALSGLVHDGYIRQLPDIIDTTKMFDWILDRSRIHNKIYGIPFLTCAAVLICRDGEAKQIRNIYELPNSVAAPMQSMINNYYAYALCNFQSRKEDLKKALLYFKNLLGEEDYEKSRFSQYDGIERFNKGEVKYLLGFTEDLRNLKPARYKVQMVNFSDGEKDEMPLLPTDFASIGKHVEGEKLLDCIDLLEMLSSSDFIYDICTANGKLQYMLPTDRTLYPRLAELDPIYNDFYELVNDENNGILRYGKEFFRDYLKLEEELIKMLNAKEE